MENLPAHAKAICHGIRNGAELKYFKNYLVVEIIGTEISPTATRFSDTIQWDFHDVKKEWENSFDFIYSNSFDHSYNPEHCIQQWMSCLKKDGACFLEHSLSDVKASKLDPFGATFHGMHKLINYAGKGLFHVSRILTPQIDPNKDFRKATWGELPSVVYYVVQYRKKRPDQSVA